MFLGCFNNFEWMNVCGIELLFFFVWFLILFLERRGELVDVGKFKFL